MEVLFESSKNKKIIFGRLLLFVIIPTVIFIVGIGLVNGLSLEYFTSFAPFLAMICLVCFGIFSFYPRRYYILNISYGDDLLIIKYIYFFRHNEIKLNVNETSFQLSGLRGSQQYLEILENSKIVIKQAPFLEWQMTLIIKIKNQLIARKIKFNKFY
jgi:hypothetical protein